MGVSGTHANLKCLGPISKYILGLKGTRIRIRHLFGILTGNQCMKYAIWKDAFDYIQIIVTQSNGGTEDAGYWLMNMYV